MEIFEWETEQTDAGVTVALIGELDLSGAGKLDEELMRVESTVTGDVVIDLRRLRFLDSTGLRVLTSANSRAAGAGRTLRIVRGPDEVQRIFEITGLDRHFELVDPED